MKPSLDSYPLLSLTLLLAWMCPLAARGELGLGGDRGEVEVEARSVELDQDAGTAVFEGDVRLRHGELELRCQRLTAEVDSEGSVSRIQATGEVRLAAGTVTATAGAAVYEPSTGIVTLRGGPVVHHSGGRLSGRVIVYRSRQGRLTVEEARGVFRLR